MKIVSTCRAHYRLWAILPLLLVLSLYSCGGHQTKIDEATTSKLPSLRPGEYEEVSIINLIATPEKYNGKRVRVIGYFNLEYENDAVYLHKEDFDMRVGKNCVGLILSREMRDSPHFKSCNHKYVFVEGTFDMDAGNMGSFKSSLDSVVRLDTKAPRNRLFKPSPQAGLTRP